jgi:uncharacterized protein (TIGR02611 family)
MHHIILKTYNQAKRLIVAVLGFSLLVVGIAMIVLPGPAIVVIPLGLAILATEFVWARKLLVKVKDRIERMKNSNGSKDAQTDSNNCSAEEIKP